MKPTVIDFGYLFDTYIADHPKIFAHDRSTTIGASEAFNCMRQLVFEKRHKEFGCEPDEDYEMDWGATHRGDVVENFFLVPALTHSLPKIGMGLILAGSSDGEQQTFVANRNSATPDGLIVNVPNGPVQVKYRDHVIDIENVTTGCIYLEFKSIDPRAVLTEERAKHHGQVQIGLGILNETTEFKPQHAIILYVNASFYSEINPFVVEFEPGIYQSGKMRAGKVWTYASPKDAPPEGRLNKGCDYCRWRKACGAAILSQYAETRPDTSPEVLEACVPSVLSNLDAKDALDAAEVKFETAKQALKDAMAQQKTNRLKSEQFSVSWSTVKGTPRPSVKAMREAGLDLTPYMVASADYDKLVVTLKKQK